MKVIRHFTSLVLSLVCFSVLAEMDFNKDFNQFAEGQKGNFDHFVEENDLVFLNMLKDNWQEFESMPGLVRDPTPKPKIVPKSENSTVVNNQVFSKSKPIAIVKEAKAEIPFNGLVFFGNRIELADIKVVKLKDNDEKSLYDFWKDNASIDHRDLFKSLTRYKRDLILSDWAYQLLVKQYSEKQGRNSNESVALAWFLLSKSGYKVRVAYNREKVLLLTAADQTVYSVPYFKIQGERFYSLQGKISGRVKTHKANYNAMSAAFDMRFKKTLITKPSIRLRKIKYENYNLKLPYDFQRIRYYATYPQLDLRYYFSAPIGKVSEKGLRKNIPKLLNGHKVNRLLHFVHKTFPYALDGDQFGKENYLLLEEVLHYQASDCEDRSVLFYWIAKNILHEKMVALEYPGHVSTAVQRNGKLLSADPTYIGSRLGDVMPKYTKVKPTKITE